MKKLYNVSIEMTGTPEELNSIQYFSYLVTADTARSAMSRAFIEVYKDGTNFKREVLAFHVEKLDTLEG